MNTNKSRRAPLRHIYLITFMSLLSFLGLPGKSRAERVGFDAQYGMTLLQQNKFDESSAYFQKYLEGNAIAYYGLALAKFKRDPSNLTLGQAREIIDLYEQAIALSPNFSDAYFMCGMAYNFAAGYQLGIYNKNRMRRSPEAFKESDAFLDKAEQYFDKAVELNPGFSRIVADEVELNLKLTTLSDKLKAEQ